ncbi:hypothetical protein HY045_01415 [Candidatus Woesebacteria bacterium]|nr:hypothetical protein [Candidatus Woesebacteria bacterium]
MAPHIEEGTNTELSKLYQYFVIDLNGEHALNLDRFDNLYFGVAEIKREGSFEMGMARFMVSAEGRMYVFKPVYGHEDLLDAISGVGETIGKPLCGGFVLLRRVNGIVTSRKVTNYSLGFDQSGTLFSGDSDNYKFGPLRAKLPADIVVE